jgi:hypothetical protein
VGVVITAPNPTASLGDQRIAEATKNVSWRVKFQDRTDLFQAVNLELCEELGEDYREKISSPTDDVFKTTDEYKNLIRCVDRVRKRFTRSKNHQSIDRLKEDGGFTPVDPRSCMNSHDTLMVALLRLHLDSLEPTERLMLELLRDDVPHDEIMILLGMGRTKFYKLKKEVFGKLADLLLGDHR